MREYGPWRRRRSVCATDGRYVIIKPRRRADIAPVVCRRNHLGLRLHNRAAACGRRRGKKVRVQAVAPLVLACACASNYGGLHSKGWDVATSKVEWL